VKVLGIESTAHTFGLGVLEDNKIIKKVFLSSGNLIIKKDM